METKFLLTLSNYLAVGSAAVAVFLLTGGVTDPVNAPKLFALGGFAFACLGLLVYGYRRAYLKVSIIELLAFLFLIWAFLVSVLSKSPFSQNFYGVYGRNTGFLTYFCLVVILLASSHLSDIKNIYRVLWGFIAAALINILYSTWVLVFGDFVGWNNQYGTILGTFGNPNFISSFLGLVFSGLFILFVGIESKKRFYFLLLMSLVFWLLTQTDSIQGLVVAVIGIWIISLFWVRSKFKSALVQLGYLISGILLAALGIQGALGSGLLKNLLAQPTIAFREQYWFSAWMIGKNHPFFGVGMDSFGDWYRRGRGAQALVQPGPDTVTNAAHNTFLDLFASGGFPLILLYFALLLLCIRSIVRISISHKKFDIMFVGLTTLWLCFQIQSLISINQIGLAIWGWLLSGLVIAYERSFRKENDDPKETKLNKSQNNKQIVSPQIFAFIGMLVGCIIAVPPLNADMKWRVLQSKGQLDLLEPALTESYMNPLNSFKLAQAVEILENNKLPDLAIKYAREGVEFNPDYFTAWQMLYFATNSTPLEKNKSKSEMLRLDPLNSKLRKLP